MNFKCSKEDMHKITQAADRYADLWARGGGRIDRLRKSDIIMSLAACHANGCPLDLDQLLGSADLAFAGDVAGICSHISPKTGKLRRSFLPKFRLVPAKKARVRWKHTRAVRQALYACIAIEIIGFTRTSADVRSILGETGSDAIKTKHMLARAINDRVASASTRRHLLTCLDELYAEALKKEKF